MIDIEPAWVTPTWFIDSDSAEVGDFAAGVTGAVNDPTEMAVALFHAVRDGIRYDPYASGNTREAYRASVVVGSASNWCVPKAVLLAAAARNRGIPARLGFADVLNHLTSKKLSEHMGTDVFAWHGYTEFLLRGRWFKVSSAFNIELCERFGVKTLDFDGTADALMHPYDVAGNRHMEYVKQHGSFDDLPLERILAEFERIYPTWMAQSGDLTDPDEAFAPNGGA